MNDDNNLERASDDDNEEAFSETLEESKVASNMLFDKAKSSTQVLT